MLVLFLNASDGVQITSRRNLPKINKQSAHYTIQSSVYKKKASINQQDQESASTVSKSTSKIKTKKADTIQSSINGDEELQIRGIEEGYRDQRVTC